jgi:hypothetical protein
MRNKIIATLAAAVLAAGAGITVAQARSTSALPSSGSGQMDRGPGGGPGGPPGRMP